MYSPHGMPEEGIPQIPLVDDMPALQPTTATSDGSLSMATAMSAVADDPRQLCAGLGSEATLLRSAEDLLRLYTRLPPLQLTHVISAVQDSRAAVELLALAASLNPVEEREMAWELLWRIARAAVRQPLPAVDVTMFVNTLQTTLRVSNWKYSHDLLCSEASLNAAALRAAESLAAGWPAACPRFVAIVPDVVTMLAAAPAPAVRRACVSLLSTLSCSTDLHQALLRTAVIGSLRTVLESDRDTLHPLAAAVGLANLIGGNDDPVVTGSGSTDLSTLAPLLIERLVGGLRIAVRSPHSLHDRPGAQREEDKIDDVATRSLTMSLLSMSTGEAHKRALGDAGVIAQLAKCLQQPEEELHHNIGADSSGSAVSPRPLALRCLLQLSFDSTNRDRMLEDKQLLECLHAQSAAVTISHASLRRDAMTLLWMLGLRSPVETAKQNPSKQHVLVSYTVKQQHIMLRIKSSLTQAGYNVWAEADGSATSPDELAAAVDNACAIVIGASAAFCQSPLCRLITERAHSQGREVVPLLTEANYTPAGWLRQMYSGRRVTWFDFGHSTQQDDYLYAAQMQQLAQVLGHRGQRMAAASANSLATASGFSPFPGVRESIMMGQPSLGLSPVAGGMSPQQQRTPGPQESFHGPNASFQSHQQELSRSMNPNYSTASVGFSQHGHTIPSDGRWDVAEVSQWFRTTLPFASQYQTRFESLGLDKATLSMMTEQDLTEEIGVSSRLHRRAILTEIQKLQPRAAARKVGGELSPSTRCQLASAMNFDGNLDTFPDVDTPERESFDDAFKHAVARCFNFAAGGDGGGSDPIAPDDVEITSVTAGSVIVQFTVLVAAIGSVGAGAAALVQATKAASSVSGLIVGGYQAKARPLLPFTDIGPPPAGSQNSPRGEASGYGTPRASGYGSPRVAMERQVSKLARTGSSTKEHVEEVAQLHLKLIEAQVAQKTAEAQAVTADAEKKRQADVSDKVAQQMTEAQLEISTLKVALATADANAEAADRRGGTAESKLGTTEEKLEAAIERIGELRASAGNAAAAPAETNADDAAELKTLRSKATKAERAQEALQDEAAELRKELKTNERELKTAKAAAKAADSGGGGGGASDELVDSLQEDLAAASSRAEAAEREAERFKAKLSEDKDASDSMALTEAAVAEEKERGAQELEAAKAEMAELTASQEETIAELEQQVEEAQTARNEADVRAGEFEEKAEEADALAEELETVKLEVETLQMELDEVMAGGDGGEEDEEEEEAPAEEPAEEPEEPGEEVAASTPLARQTTSADIGSMDAAESLKEGKVLWMDAKSGDEKERVLYITATEMRLFKTRKTAQAGKVWKSYPFATTMACESSDENVQIQDASTEEQLYSFRMDAKIKKGYPWAGSPEAEAESWAQAVQNAIDVLG